MRYFLTALFLINVAFAQMTIKSNGISIQRPFQTGAVSIHITKEGIRRPVYAFYQESANIKNLELYAGAGIHMGPRYSPNYKGDGTAFLAGAACLLGARYWLGKVGFGAELLPRVDFPFFGGCEMHKRCGEHDANGSITLSIKL